MKRDYVLPSWEQLESGSAIQSLMKIAEQGEPHAEYMLAQAFERGIGVTQSDAEALKWYHRAAQHSLERLHERTGKVA